MKRGPGSPVRSFLWSLPLALLAGCGGSGGGGGGGGTPPPGNTPPAFTSPAAANAPENSVGTIYQAAATDPEGNPVTFSLSGGTDRAFFTITPTGALSFAQNPDFEFPGDAGANNVYEVQLSVSDGFASATRKLSGPALVTVTARFRVARVATGFNQPVYLTAFPDGSGSVFVVERNGRIRILNPTNGTIAATPFLDVSAQISTDGERGLLGFAPAPNFTTSRTFYVFLTAPGGQIQIRRYQTLAGNLNQADPATGDTILTIDHPLNNHNGGWLEFGPDGLLYAAVGDGGGGGDPDNNAQNTNVLLGKLLRIDPSADDFPLDTLRDYRIPAGNPFASGAAGRPEIWAYGLRNPFRNSFDPLTQNLWIGDVGQGAREEIDLMRPNDGGANFGWRVLEGTAVFNGTPTASMVAPVAEYLHGSGQFQGNSVTGGIVYRGPVEALRGQYVFADFIVANIWSFPIARAVLGSTIPSSQFIQRAADFAPNAGAFNNIVSFGTDQSGNLYIVDFDGEIFRIEAQ